MLLKNDEVIQSAQGVYQVQGKIGSESTFGAVFKALDQNGKPVVVKQLLGPTHISQNVGMDYDYVRTTFEREAKILVAHNHPNIVKAYDFFERDEDLFLIMEFINGEDLDQALIRHLEKNNNIPFSEEQAAPIGIEICRAIHAIHQLPGQILFRDMKPRNVMWDAGTRTIKIIDFGTARFMDDSRNATVALGTEGYSPPEFYSKSSVLSFASDVYTIGATLYELVTAELPDKFQTPNHFYGQDANLSDQFKAVIQTAMQQEQSQRFQTAQEMAEALQALPSAQGNIAIQTQIKNPYPYLSCFCVKCGAQPDSAKSVFCTQCGGRINVISLKIIPADADLLPMELFLDKQKNLIGRSDMEERIFPDVDLSRYDPESYVSRKHCVLKREGIRFFLTALQTTNRTEINGVVLPPHKTGEVSGGDTIMLANLTMKFETKACIP